MASLLSVVGKPPASARSSAITMKTVEDIAVKKEFTGSIGYVINNDNEKIEMSSDFEIDTYLEVVKVKGLSSWKINPLVSAGQDKTTKLEINIHPNYEGLFKKIYNKDKKMKFMTIKRLYVITVPMGEFKKGKTMDIKFINSHNCDETKKIIGQSTHDLNEADATIFTMNHSVSIEHLEGMLKLRFECNPDYVKGKPFSTFMLAWEVIYSNKPELYTKEGPYYKTIPRIISHLKNKELDLLDSLILSGDDPKKISESINKGISAIYKNKNKMIENVGMSKRHSSVLQITDF